MSAALACPPGDEVEREALCHIVKEKWPEEAVFQAQDAVYEKMDCASAQRKHSTADCLAWQSWRWCVLLASGLEPWVRMPLTFVPVPGRTR